MQGEKPFGALTKIIPTNKMNVISKGIQPASLQCDHRTISKQKHQSNAYFDVFNHLAKIISSKTDKINKHEWHLRFVYNYVYLY